MLHPHTELRFTGDDALGVGVFATQFIPQGTLTWVTDPLDRILTAAQVHRLSPELRALVRKYSYLDERARYVLSWDHAKYMNHACDANTLGPVPAFEVAVRDIHPGEEITDDYGYLNLEAPLKCACGAPNCRGEILPNDAIGQQAQWLARLAGPLARMPDVDQPLLAYATAGVLRQLRGYLNQPLRARQPARIATHDVGASPGRARGTRRRT